MNDWKLTDEEMDAIKDKIGWLEDLQKESHLNELCRTMTKAATKKMIEWLKKHNEAVLDDIELILGTEDWQALLKEIEK